MGDAHGRGRLVPAGGRRVPETWSQNATNIEEKKNTSPQTTLTQPSRAPEGAERASAVHAAWRAPVRRGGVGELRTAASRLVHARRTTSSSRSRGRRSHEHRRPEVLPRADYVADARALGQADGPRVAGTIADWGRERGYFASEEDGDAFEAELTHILLHQIAAFNSPVWFNVGFEESPQCRACFILSVEDTMDSILDWNTREGRIFRGGSGSGINLSNIRGSMEPLAKGGTASGPVSFMRGADSWAGTIKSGGKTRRAAKMVVLDVDHPGHPRVHLVQGQGRGQGRRAAGRRVRHVDRRRRLPLDPVPERQQLRAGHGRVHARGRGRRRLAPDRAHHR